MGNGNHSSEIVSGEPEIFSQLRGFEGVDGVGVALQIVNVLSSGWWEG